MIILTVALVGDLGERDAADVDAGEAESSGVASSWPSRLWFVAIGFTMSSSWWLGRNSSSTLRLKGDACSSSPSSPAWCLKCSRTFSVSKHSWASFSKEKGRGICDFLELAGRPGDGHAGVQAMESGLPKQLWSLACAESWRGSQAKVEGNGELRYPRSGCGGICCAIPHGANEQSMNIRFFDWVVPWYDEQFWASVLIVGRFAMLPCPLGENL